MRALACAAVIVLLAASPACKKSTPGSTTPSTTGGSTTTTPAATPAPEPAPVSDTPSLNMPIDPADTANNALGLWPFGVHGASHASDGHPGWDVEFRPGATLRAPADGTVSSIVADPSSPSLFTMQISHGTSQRYRTDYTNLASIATGVAVGTKVTAGQAIATPATITAFIGSRQVTYAMTHFQFDDFQQNIGQTNPFAVNPESYLSASGRSVFETIWTAAAYSGELCEPFPGNTRDVNFPLTRTWTQASGTLAARIAFTRNDPVGGGSYTYAFINASGAVVEDGAATVDATASPLSTIDFQPASGGTRRGVWDVVSETMRIDYGAPGASRPGSLAGASVFKTSR